MSGERLLGAVKKLTVLVEKNDLDEKKVLEHAKWIMSDLVSQDDWLDDEFARPDPEYYQQYLLYGDPLGRFSLVSFVWAGGQQTPVHDHTVWGVIGMLRGSEMEKSYTFNEHGILQETGQVLMLKPGQVTCVSPSSGDIHQVSNTFADQTSISIHLYGGNIGRIQRHVFYPGTSDRKQFVSGYSSNLAVNLWV